MEAKRSRSEGKLKVRLRLERRTYLVVYRLVPDVMSSGNQAEQSLEGRVVRLERREERGAHGGRRKGGRKG